MLCEKMIFVVCSILALFFNLTTCNYLSVDEQYLIPSPYPDHPRPLINLEDKKTDLNHAFLMKGNIVEKSSALRDLLLEIDANLLKLKSYNNPNSPLYHPNAYQLPGIYYETILKLKKENSSLIPWVLPEFFGLIPPQQWFHKRFHVNRVRRSSENHLFDLTDERMDYFLPKLTRNLHKFQIPQDHVQYLSQTVLKQLTSDGSYFGPKLTRDFKFRNPKEVLIWKKRANQAFYLKYLHWLRKLTKSIDIELGGQPLARTQKFQVFFKRPSKGKHAMKNVLNMRKQEDKTPKTNQKVSWLKSNKTLNVDSELLVPVFIRNVETENLKDFESNVVPLTKRTKRSLMRSPIFQSVFNNNNREKGFQEKFFGGATVPKNQQCQPTTTYPALNQTTIKQPEGLRLPRISRVKLFMVPFAFYGLPSYFPAVPIHKFPDTIINRNLIKNTASQNVKNSSAVPSLGGLVKFGQGTFRNTITIPSFGFLRLPILKSPNAKLFFEPKKDISDENIEKDLLIMLNKKLLVPKMKKTNVFKNVSENLHVPDQRLNFTFKILPQKETGAQNVSVRNELLRIPHEKVRQPFYLKLRYDETTKKSLPSPDNIYSNVSNYSTTPYPFAFSRVSTQVFQGNNTIKNDTIISKNSTNSYLNFPSFNRKTIFNTSPPSTTPVNIENTTEKLLQSEDYAHSNASNYSTTPYPIALPHYSSRPKFLDWSQNNYSNPNNTIANNSIEDLSILNNSNDFYRNLPRFNTTSNFQTTPSVELPHHRSTQKLFRTESVVKNTSTLAQNSSHNYWKLPNFNSSLTFNKTTISPIAVPHRNMSKLFFDWPQHRVRSSSKSKIVNDLRLPILKSPNQQNFFSFNIQNATPEHSVPLVSQNTISPLNLVKTLKNHVDQSTVNSKITDQPLGTFQIPKSIEEKSSSELINSSLSDTRTKNLVVTHLKKTIKNRSEQFKESNRSDIPIDTEVNPSTSTFENIRKNEDGTKKERRVFVRVFKRPIFSKKNIDGDQLNKNKTI
ncbi:hypothetical protein ABEB36_006976 [Hypothenemus hampei]|uniref:Uncharacterized protein n=1 Tax=Hypothenemus hampei TaxID=57062 RepID=A0ABD1ESC9_HYPHA